MKFNVEGIGFSYGSTEILDGIRMDIDEGDIVSILGPNGAGKTTLLKCLNNILHPDSGIIEMDGRSIIGMKRLDIAKEMGYVPQRGETSRVTVFESVLLGRKPHIDMNPTNKDLKIAGKVIELVGLSDLSSKYIDEISGGEYQLVQIARAITQQPKLILLDEPTNNLDPSNQHMIMHVVQRVVKNNGMAAVMVVHDLNLAIRHSDKFIMMKEGSVYAAGGIEIITPENINAVYNIDSYVETIHGIPIIIPKEIEE